MCHSDFGSYKFSRATFRRHAIVLVLFAMALHHQVKLKRKRASILHALAPWSNSKVVTSFMNQCCTLCNRLFCSNLQEPLLQPIFRSSDYEKSVVHISKVSLALSFGERTWNAFSSVDLSKFVCVQQKMHKMGQKPFVSPGLMDICLLLSHIDEKGLTQVSRGAF